ncbi:hypothetical protein VIGAN_10182200 [Vigna angularis var. angularis]|uniref:F-box domain-containing protein n=1 Tax=Vigna angularis var. angularis TaxID=157739 RepID=A0A0S3T5N0_PHAAN|nr:hypothetical protein VIGAN_10182200 [Vigna angularis var. angularis]
MHKGARERSKLCAACDWFEEASNFEGDWVYGDWDDSLVRIGCLNGGLVEIHLEKVQVSDVGLVGVARCLRLETLHVVKTAECSNVGLAMVAERCRLLRKVHIDGWRTNRIGDDGLAAIAKHCPDLQELVLIGVYPTFSSLAAIACNCRNLERLALCGLERSSFGVSNLVKVKVKKCRKITGRGVEWVREKRVSLAFNYDDSEVEALDGSGSDGVGELRMVWQRLRQTLRRRLRLLQLITTPD